MAWLMAWALAWAAWAQWAWAGPGPHGPDAAHPHETTAPSPGAGAGLARWPDGQVEVPKLAQRRLGLRTEVAVFGEQPLTVSLPAQVVADPNASGWVQSVHGGRLEPGPKGLPLVGQAVRQGDILAWVHHRADPYALAQQQSQQAELQAAAALAQQRLSQLESLGGIVPRKEVDAARIEAQALAQRERSLAASLDVREALRAPLTGRVARMEGRAGQVVQAHQVVMEVVNPQRLLVEATTADVALAGRIRSASLQAPAGLSLSLVGAAPALRDGVLPLNFRVQAQAAASPLALGQSLTVLARLQESRSGVVLPASALVRSPSNETVVWLKTGPERFAPQPVQSQPLDGQTVLVTQGLASGQRVVVQGAALLAQIR